MLKQIALWIIFARAAADTLSLLFPGVLEWVKKMGWPIDKYWVKTVWPVTLAMLLSSSVALLGYGTGIHFKIYLIVIPICWAIVLVTQKGSSPLMKFDAVTWVSIAVCAYFA